MERWERREVGERGGNADVGERKEGEVNERWKGEAHESGGKGELVRAEERGNW